MGGNSLQRNQPTPVHLRPAGLDVLLRPIHAWVWGDAHRSAHKLLRFAETEADGGRDVARAAELTRDGLLRRLYLRHAIDELRHADMFRKRGQAMLAALPKRDAALEANWLAPGERGLDDLHVEHEATTRCSPSSTCASAPRRALRRVPRRARARSGHARGLRANPARRGVSHELHASAARARLAPPARLAPLGRRGSTRLWKVLSALRDRRLRA